MGKNNSGILSHRAEIKPTPQAKTQTKTNTNTKPINPDELDKAIKKVIRGL